MRVFLWAQLVDRENKIMEKKIDLLKSDIYGIQIHFGQTVAISIQKQSFKDIFVKKSFDDYSVILKHCKTHKTFADFMNFVTTFCLTKYGIADRFLF